MIVKVKPNERITIMYQQLPTEVIDDKIIVELPNDFSGMSVDRYREQFDSLANTHQDNIVLNFNKTEFIDSSGIGAMVFLFKRIEQRGVNMQLLKVNGQPRKLMTLLRVDLTIDFIDE